MNCKHCKAQWTPPPTVSISSCPFCGKPLVNSADVGRNSKPEVILRQVVERFDMSILSEKRLSAILKDLMPHVERKYLRIFTQAINDGIGEKLLKLTKESQELRTASVYTLKGNFRQHNGYDHTADYVVDCFIYALGWVSKVEEQQSQHGINHINQLNQQVELAFADMMLTKDEARLLFQAGNEMGIADDAVAAAIDQKIKDLNLKPSDTIKKNHKNLKNRICSTDWIVKIKEVKIEESYRSVKIGKQIWLAENLNVDYFRNGDLIPLAKTTEEWKAAGEKGQPAWCYNNNDPKNGEKYGKLYNWYAVNDPRGLAPKGWHIPGDDEWTQLTDFLGGEEVAGTKMKSIEGWIACRNSTNESDFNGQPGGGRFIADGHFGGIGYFGYWWSSAESNSYNALGRFIFHLTAEVLRDDFNMACGFSVRCIKDTTEEKKIKEVTIGKQVWMAENLNVNTFCNGDPIPQAKTSEEWQAAGEKEKPAWCYYNNDPKNGEKYGKLYNWYAVNDPRGLAPNGWHIPGDEEWTELTTFLGGEKVAGTKMKSTFGWEFNGNGTNESEFNGLPGGFRSSNGELSFVGTSGHWWSTTERNKNCAWSRILYYLAVNVLPSDNKKVHGFSVRCIKDTTEEKKIKEVTIGKQVWMAENLNVDTFCNGDPIPQAKTDDEWEKAGKNKQPAWCYYDNDPKNGEKYGKLYNWYAVDDNRGLAPRGWHIPDEDEWTKLTNFLGFGGVAETKMKITTGWNDNENGTNESGFNGLPGGYRCSLGFFHDIGCFSDWWCSKEGSSYLRWFRLMEFNEFHQLYYGSKGYGFSVRCIKD